MIGFITDIQTAQAVLDGIRNAQESRGLPYYWTTGSYPIYTRTHAGKVFLPFDDEMMATNLRGGWIGRTDRPSPTSYHQP